HEGCPSLVQNAEGTGREPLPEFCVIPRKVEPGDYDRQQRLIGRWIELRPDEPIIRRREPLHSPGRQVDDSLPLQILREQEVVVPVARDPGVEVAGIIPSDGGKTSPVAVLRTSATVMVAYSGNSAVAYPTTSSR